MRHPRHERQGAKATLQFDRGPCQDTIRPTRANLMALSGDGKDADHKTGGPRYSLGWCSFDPMARLRGSKTHGGHLRGDGYNIVEQTARWGLVLRFRAARLQLGLFGLDLLPENVSDPPGRFDGERRNVK